MDFFVGFIIGWTMYSVFWFFLVPVATNAWKEYQKEKRESSNGHDAEEPPKR